METKIKTSIVYNVEFNEKEKHDLCTEIMGLPAEEFPVLKDLHQAILNPV